MKSSLYCKKRPVSNKPLKTKTRKNMQIIFKCLLCSIWCNYSLAIVILLKTDCILESYMDTICSATTAETPAAHDTVQNTKLDIDWGEDE